MSAARTFQKGSGCFICSSCGNRTRVTTQDVDTVCEDCYELAGLENGVADGHPFTDYAAEARERYNRIVSKGGKYAFWTELAKAVQS